MLIVYFLSDEKTNKINLVCSCSRGKAQHASAKSKESRRKHCAIRLSIVHLLVCSHPSLIRLLRFAGALCCAHLFGSLTHSLRSLKKSVVFIFQAAQNHSAVSNPASMTSVVTTSFRAKTLWNKRYQIKHSLDFRCVLVHTSFVIVSAKPKQQCCLLHGDILCIRYFFWYLWKIA